MRRPGKNTQSNGRLGAAFDQSRCPHLNSMSGKGRESIRTFRACIRLHHHPKPQIIVSIPRLIAVSGSRPAQRTLNQVAPTSVHTVFAFWRTFGINCVFRWVSRFSSGLRNDMACHAKASDRRCYPQILRKTQMWGLRYTGKRGIFPENTEIFLDSHFLKR